MAVTKSLGAERRGPIRQRVRVQSAEHEKRQTEGRACGMETQQVTTVVA